jgi:hypothetical protein
VILSYADALALHGAIVANPDYREGRDPDVDAILSRLEAFIGGGRVERIPAIQWREPDYSVRVPDDAA